MNRVLFILFLVELSFFSLHGMEQSTPCRVPIDIASRRSEFFQQLEKKGIVLQVDTERAPVEGFYLRRLAKKRVKPEKEMPPARPIKSESFLSLPFLPDITGLDECIVVAGPPHKITPRYRPPMRKKTVESIVLTDQ